MKKGSSEWPCNECSRLSHGIGRVDHYTLPGDKSKLELRKVSGRYKIVSKGDHYESEEVK